MIEGFFITSLDSFEESKFGELILAGLMILVKRGSNLREDYWTSRKIFVMADLRFSPHNKLAD